MNSFQVEAFSIPQKFQKLNINIEKEILNDVQTEKISDLKLLGVSENKKHTIIIKSIRKIDVKNVRYIKDVNYIQNNNIQDNDIYLQSILSIYYMINSLHFVCNIKVYKKKKTNINKINSNDYINIIDELF